MLICTTAYNIGAFLELGEAGDPIYYLYTVFEAGDPIHFLYRVFEAGYPVGNLKPEIPYEEIVKPEVRAVRLKISVLFFKPFTSAHS